MIAALTATFMFATLAPTVQDQPKPPVIMIHGAGGGGWEYDFWKPVFQEAGYQVIARDLLPTDGDYANTTFQDYIDQLNSWIPKGTKPVLVGASMGGMLSLVLAEKVDPSAIVLINSVAPKDVVDPIEGFNFPPIQEWENGPLEDTRAAMPDSDEKTILWAHEKWRNESGQVLNTMLTEGINVKIPTCPVLVIIGADDTDVPASVSRDTADFLKADVKTYAKTSHVGPLLGRRAQEIATDTTHWLNRRLQKDQ